MEEQIRQWRCTFGSRESFERSRLHTLSCLLGFGRRTITTLVRTQNRQQQDWTADYRFYSHDRFDEEAAGSFGPEMLQILEAKLGKP